MPGEIRRSGKAALLRFTLGEVRPVYGDALERYEVGPFLDREEVARLKRLPNLDFVAEVANMVCAFNKKDQYTEELNFDTP